MISENLLLPILFISLFLELTLIPFPLVLLISLLLYILFPKSQTVILVFVAGLLLDVLSVSPLGKTSIFILASFLVIDLYKKAFEIKDPRVLLIILAFSTYLYSRIFSYPSSLIAYIILFGSVGIVISYFMRGSKLWLK